jgi:hypothetical protein
VSDKSTIPDDADKKEKENDGTENKKIKLLKSKSTANINKESDREEITKKLTNKTPVVYFLLLNANKIGALK